MRTLLPLIFFAFGTPGGRERSPGVPDTGYRLAAKAEFSDDGAIALDVDVGEVVEEPTTLTHQHEKTTAAVVVLLVGLQMFGQVIDSISEQSDLDLRRPGVIL